MIYSSLAVLAMSASALVNPLTNLVHMHPQHDNRVSVVLINKGMNFEDVKIGDRVYTVEASHTLFVKAPAGTVVYAASRTATHRRGDAILEITPQLNNQKVTID